MSLPDTTKLKKLVYAVCSKVSSTNNFHVTYSEAECSGLNSCLNLHVHQSNGDYGSEVIYSYGEDKWNPDNNSKAKDFHDLVRGAEFQLEQWAKKKRNLLNEFISYDDQVTDFYVTYCIDRGVMPKSMASYFVTMGKKVSIHFSEWLEKKFFPNIKEETSFLNVKDFLSSYKKYCVFESRE